MQIVPTPWSPGVLVLRWETPPPEEWFSAGELAHAASYRLQKRRDEYLLSRAAAKQLAANLTISPAPVQCQVDGRRLIVPGDLEGWRVSVSHSAPYAAAAISRDAVGVDVQVIRPFDDDAAHLFLSPLEIEAMQRCSIDHRLLHFWCAKEAAWKRRSEQFLTMRQLPLELIEERESSLRFDDAQTVRIDDVIVAWSG